MPMKIVLELIAVVCVLLVASGCMKKHIYTEIDIEAPREQVWAILVDNATYPEWNPYHVRVEGKMEVGEELVVELHKPNGNQLTIEPHVMRVVPLEELTWGGGLWGVFNGEHVFLLNATSTGGTKLVQKEDFWGIAIPFAELDTIEEGYNLMNEALKKRAEAMAAASGVDAPAEPVAAE
ncbi:MAG: SRPBCC domain-containing protein [Chrysiogenetes bacterium]|nr:SRPBCC domain-containing protein [Chrysiogenetes bacterium]